MKNKDKYVGIKEAANFLNVTRQTLRNWDNNGKFKSFRHPTNNYRLYKKEKLLELMNKFKKELMNKIKNGRLEKW